MVYKRIWSCFATPLAVPQIWRCYAIFWPLRHPRHAASATGSARLRSLARACLGQVLSNKKETVTKTVTVSFWQGQKDLVSPAGSVGASALRAEVSTGDPHPSTRSACRVFKLFNPSQNKKTPAGVFLFWQGQKDLNPRHAVLERKARFQLSRVLKCSPPQYPHKNSTFRIWKCCSFLPF